MIDTLDRMMDAMQKCLEIKTIATPTDGMQAMIRTLADVCGRTVVMVLQQLLMTIKMDAKPTSNSPTNPEGVGSMMTKSII